MLALIDPHSPITAFATTLMVISLHGVHSFTERKGALVKFKDEKHFKHDGWITTFSYGHDFLVERTDSSKEVLDEVYPDHLEIMTHLSGLMGVFNIYVVVMTNINKNKKS